MRSKFIELFATLGRRTILTIVEYRQAEFRKPTPVSRTLKRDISIIGAEFCWSMKPEPHDERSLQRTQRKVFVIVPE